MIFEDSVAFCREVGRDTPVTHTVATQAFPHGGGLHVRYFRDQGEIVLLDGSLPRLLGCSRPVVDIGTGYSREEAMQYLVEGARGPLPPSPEQAIALLEQTVIPHFEYVIRLKTEGKILAGGLPVGDRAFVFIIEAPSNDEADRIVRDMPAWGLLEWKVTPLQNVEARAEMERKVVQALRSAR